LGLMDAEDRAEDDLEGYRFGVGAQRERLTDRPALHVAFGDFTNDFPVAPDPFAVEWRQQQFALAEMLVAVEGQNGVLAQRRLEHGRVRLAGVKACRVAGKDLLHQARVRQVDDAAETGKGDAEDVAVASAQPDEEANRIPAV